MHIESKNKDILIIGEGPAEGLDDTTLTAEAKYSINFTQPRKIIYFAYTVMEAAVSYFLTLQKYINSKQNTLNNKF